MQRKIDGPGGKADRVAVGAIQRFTGREARLKAAQDKRARKASKRAQRAAR